MTNFINKRFPRPIPSSRNSIGVHLPMPAINESHQVAAPPASTTQIDMMSTDNAAEPEMEVLKDESFSADAGAARVAGASDGSVVDGLKAGRGGSMPLQITPEENRAVRRKIDMVLMPLLLIAYCCAYIEKSAMSYAVLFNFRVDAHLSSREYSLLGTMYYLGYLAFEFPGGYLLQRLPLNRFMSVLVILWGAILMCMAAPRSFSGLAALRFLLGAAEACVTPGFVLLSSRFYTRREQPLRVGFWYCANGFGNLIGGLLAYGMGHIHANKVPSWAWIYLINGSITVLFGCIFAFLCPNSPATAWFLSPRERLIALERVRPNQSSLEGRRWKWEQFWEAVLPWRDPQAWWLFFITLSLTIPNGGLGNFLHLILQQLGGYSPLKTTLMGLPQGFMQIVFPLFASWAAGHFENARLNVIMMMIFPSLVGVVIQYCTNDTGPELFGFYIIGAFVGSVGQVFALVINTTGWTKRVTTSSMIFIAYGLGNSIGPLWWTPDETPAYKSGIVGCIACFAMTLPLSWGLRRWYARENARRDTLLQSDPTSYPANDDVAAGAAFEDVTDRENLNYRYAL